ncbi:hypothetical protein [Nitrobacter winogradskyi]|uniref:Uncharacterized protein n=2 Tax=Nitrobacter winogradskyi TaxID=913 RepID=A0ACC6AJF3_NITWI|nr:hypothetical protein [Nitrobacter winogradskyi]MCP1999110.1 hypothetical protein [Nitrobacter winogradskyi]GEC17602.1 hypothetical protein NWI01_34940 [Nitrobacter winogradskyi]
MKDLKLYLDKLHANSEHCITISKSTLNNKKREVFEVLAATYRKLASDIEAVIATNAILDEERDKRLIGLLGKDDNSADSVTEITRLLGQSPEQSKSPAS